MALVPDQYDRIALTCVFDGFKVDFCYQWARGIDDLEVFGFGFFPYLWCYTMGAKHDCSPRRNLEQRIDKYDSFRAQLIDHMTIVDDLFANIERLLVHIESDIVDVDCTHYAGAETAGLGEKNLFEMHEFEVI